MWQSGLRVVLGLFLISTRIWATEQSTNLLISREGQPAAHTISGDATIVLREGQPEITAGAGGYIKYTIALSPKWKYLYLNMAMRSEEITPGKEGWMDGRLAMCFFDKEHKRMLPWPNVFHIKGTNNWTRCQRIYDVPANAAYVEIIPANYGLSGRVSFSQLRLTPCMSLSSIDRDAPSPNGMAQQKLWSWEDAYLQRTTKREIRCLNGLWQFFAVVEADQAARVPATGSGWGYFKVPGSWPGSLGGWTQTIYRSPLLEVKEKDDSINRAWYRRTVDVPDNWKDMKVELAADMIQSCAKVFVDGKAAGELYYPGGIADLSAFLVPGKTHELALLVTAIPDQNMRTEFMAPERIVKMPSGMANRGITGDLYLRACPKNYHISDVHVITSVRQKTITFDTGISSPPGAKYFLEAEVFDHGQKVRSWRSPLYTSTYAESRRHSFSAEWNAPKLWDTDTPENLYSVVLRIKDESETILDELEPDSFGFREFWIDGRDFFLNGSKIHLRSIFNNSMCYNSGISQRELCYQAALRIKKLGFNHMISGAYTLAPGKIGYLFNVYNEASRAGVLTSLTMPHASQFDWKLERADIASKYREQAAYFIRKYQNIPGIVFYAMNHNATGYAADQNPLTLVSGFDPDKELRQNKSNEKLWEIRQEALKAASLVKGIDQTRPVYHHESGALGDMITLNCYLNWAPRQERSDWFEQWQQSGDKPLFLVEWGNPHIASWSSHRGPGFIWTEKAVQCLWMNEYNAAFLGEKAYAATAQKKALYDNQTKRCTGNQQVFFGQIMGEFQFSQDTQNVIAWMIRDNFRSMRARGVSAYLPWDQFVFWERSRYGYRAWAKRFEGLKTPGIVPDAIASGRDPIEECMDELPLTIAGKTLAEVNAEQIGWIAGRRGDFTEKGHNFRPGEHVSKQLLILNDTRRESIVKYRWNVPEITDGVCGTVNVAPGAQAFIPCEFVLPESTSLREVTVKAKFEFANGSKQQDFFVLRVIPCSTEKPKSMIGVYDPELSTSSLLDQMAIPYQKINSQDQLSSIQILIIGRNALDTSPFRLSTGAAIGVNILVMEQSYDALQRMGFRANIHGMREGFRGDGTLIHDWRGCATMTPPYLEGSEDGVNRYPQWSWNGYDNSRVWRSANRGTICSVPIEIPAIGDFIPLIRCGFDMQYAGALELRSGKRTAIFSQMDISRRTESDPEASELLREYLIRLDSPAASSPSERRVFCAGDLSTQKFLNSLHIPCLPFQESLPDDALLVVGRNSGLFDLSQRVANGANVITLGLSKDELERLLPGKFSLQVGTAYADITPGLREVPVFQGINNADLHWRNGKSGDFFSTANPFGQILSRVTHGRGSVIAVQIAPWDFDPNEKQLRTSIRRNTYLISRIMKNHGACTEGDLLSMLDSGYTRSRMNKIDRGWVGKSDPVQQGLTNQYYADHLQLDNTWRSVKVPGDIESQFSDLANYDGYFWYRNELVLPDDPANGQTCEINFGAIDDESWIWINGRLIGELTQKTNPTDYWCAPRRYELPPGVLKRGRNTITVLCNDLRMTGGMRGVPAVKISADHELYIDRPEGGDDPYRYYRW